LRHKNTVHGHHRNIFIDRGLVSTVTQYHKGYSITGSTKIIHRYLPKEVGELLVYYLWLILPFRQTLNLVANGDKADPSPFLWAKAPIPKSTRKSAPENNGQAVYSEVQECWDSARLTRVLTREFQAELGLKVGITVYRHLAVAISRKHLPCGGFKRDYGLEDTKFDQQSGHASWTAGSIYARGIAEAAGQVEERKAEYRKVSQEWHRFLGFLPASLPPRKRPLNEITNPAGVVVSKRTKTAVEADVLEMAWEY
jgi:hypothetical protein